MAEVLCEICGNPISPRDRVCPWCESPVTAAPPAARRSRVVTVNLEAGQPTSAEALKYLKNELAGARMRGVRVVRAIHGYGSSGKGGKIRSTVRGAAETLMRGGLIRTFVAGEDYDELSAAGQAFLNAEPDLRQTLRTDRLNPGITLFLL